MVSLPKAMATSFPGIGHIYDLIIVGAGISGTEAALYLANAGLDILLVSTSLDTIYNLFSDKTKLEANKASFMAEAFKEQAVDGYVASSQMHRLAKYRLEHSQGIHLLQSSASSLIVEDSNVKGIKTWEGVPRYGKYSLLAVGSFLASRLKISALEETSGRLSEMSYDDLFLDLSQYLSFADAKRNKEKELGNSAYSISYKIINDSKDYKIKALGNLYATGLCIDNDLTYEDAALSGILAAKKILQNF